VYFVLLFAFFLYFGSGAGASSFNAKLSSRVSIAFIVILPLVFNVYRVMALLVIKIANRAVFFSAAAILMVFLT
jgi:hypothetical protein